MVLGPQPGHLPGLRRRYRGATGSPSPRPLCSRGVAVGRRRPRSHAADLPGRVVGPLAELGSRCDGCAAARRLQPLALQARTTPTRRRVARLAPLRIHRSPVHRRLGFGGSGNGHGCHRHQTPQLDMGGNGALRAGVGIKSNPQPDQRLACCRRHPGLVGIRPGLRGEGVGLGPRRIRDGRHTGRQGDQNHDWGKGSGCVVAEVPDPI